MLSILCALYGLCGPIHPLAELAKRSIIISVLHSGGLPPGKTNQMYPLGLFLLVQLLQCGEKIGSSCYSYVGRILVHSQYLCFPWCIGNWNVIHLSLDFRVFYPYHFCYKKKVRLFEKVPTLAIIFFLLTHLFCFFSYVNWFKHRSQNSANISLLFLTSAWKFVFSIHWGYNFKKVLQ